MISPSRSRSPIASASSAARGGARGSRARSVSRAPRAGRDTASRRRSRRGRCAARPADRAIATRRCRPGLVRSIRSSRSSTSSQRPSSSSASQALQRRKVAWLRSSPCSVASAAASQRERGRFLEPADRVEDAALVDRGTREVGPRLRFPRDRRGLMKLRQAVFDMTGAAERAPRLRAGVTLDDLARQPPMPARSPAHTTRRPRRCGSPPSAVDLTRRRPSRAPPIPVPPAPARRPSRSRRVLRRPRPSATGSERSARG